MAERLSNARTAAFHCLNSVLLKRKPLHQAFADNRSMNLLEPRERAFAHLLTNSVLRNLGALDEVIDLLLARPLAGPDTVRLRMVMRLAAAQLLLLETKDYAVVSNAVSMVETLGGGRYCSLVNALLRNMARRKQTLLPDRQKHLRLSTPHWLWQSWGQLFGEQARDDIAEQHMLSPLLAVSVKDDPAQWQERLQARQIFGNSLVLSEGARVREIEGFAEGAWWVQDPAAALPVRAFKNVENTEILDLCAAPGGKTCQLAAAGARVTALDYSHERLKTLQENLERTGFAEKTRSILVDLEDFSEKKLYEGVMLDAPCSGTGTIRRHPDILHLKSQGEVKRLQALQCRLLKAAWRSVASGGLLVYTCCSLQREEGEAVVERCMPNLAGAELLPFSIEEVFGREHFITKEGFLRTLPFFEKDMGGMDGFFAAKIKKA